MNNLVEKWTTHFRKKCKLLINVFIFTKRDTKMTCHFHPPHWHTGRHYPELIEEVGEWDAASPDVWHNLFVSFLGIYSIDILILVHSDVHYGE